MANHAILSPSAASRWLTCTPSARLEEQFGSTTSDAAEEGTVAHAWAELMVKLAAGIITEAEYDKAVQEMEASEAADWMDGEMQQHCEDYRDFVMEQFAEAKAITPDAMLLIEERIDLSTYVPESFGTRDISIIAAGLLHVIDKKYGKGVKVSAVDNKQMKLYALGSLEDAILLYGVDRVKMSIFQPRIGNVETFEMSAAALIQWGEQFVKPQAKLAFEGKGVFVVGDHCRFCKAKGSCKAIADYNLELANDDFKEPIDPSTLSAETVAKILERADFFKKWLTAVEDHALQQAIHNGVKYPGFKLVEGRSNRVITDESQVANRFMAAGFAEELIYKPKKLLGITDLTKLAKPKKFDELTEGLIIKPVGKPTLVPADDKRPEINTTDSANEDFAEPLP